MIKISGNCANLQTDALHTQIGETVSLHGFIHKIRRMSGFAFVILRTGRELIQCVYGESAAQPLDELADNMAVVLTGKVLAEPRSQAGWELHITNWEILSKPVEAPPPVINSRRVDTSLELLLNLRPLSLRNPWERGIFKLQEGICRGMRDFLLRSRFTEIHTPKLVASSAEGGANVFTLDYFGKPACLAQSPQLYKQMMVGVFERVFEIAPVFRAEKHDTSRHINEYTGVDFEIGFIHSFVDIMQVETRMIFETLDYLKEAYGGELALLKVNMPPCTDIPAIRLDEAKAWVSKAYKREIIDLEDLDPEEERLISELIKKETDSDFVFVTHYKTAKRPFYAMENEEDPTLTDSFDLLFRGLEVTTGGQRIHDYHRQVAKLEARGMAAADFDSYLMAHKYGLPPHGGLGLGLERFTMRLLELPNIRYATLFPRDINRLEP